MTEKQIVWYILLTEVKIDSVESIIKSETTILKSKIEVVGLLEPLHALLRLADDDHLLLFKLVDAVDAALLDAVLQKL